MRKINFYKGEEITEDKIQNLFKIIWKSKLSLPDKISNINIKNIGQIAYFDEIDVNDEYLVLGEDWYLRYTFSNNIFEFLELIAVEEPTNKLIRTLEIMNVLKKLLNQHKDKTFKADMLHSTSFPFYSALKDKGYFEELTHIVDFCWCNKLMRKKLLKLEQDYGSLELFITSDDTIKYPKELEYIIHNLTFKVKNEDEKNSSLNRRR